MVDVPQIKVRQVVVCDDIRREFNGKEILIGVYGSDIVVSNFPSPLNLSFWVQFTAPEVAPEIPLEVRLMGDDELQFILLKAVIRIDRAGKGAIAIGPLPTFLQVPTNLRLQIKQKNTEWETVEEIKVDKGPVNNPGMPTGEIPAEQFRMR
jgi:hypothetical protein